MHVDEPWTDHFRIGVDDPGNVSSLVVAGKLGDGEHEAWELPRAEGDLDRMAHAHAHIRGYRVAEGLAGLGGGPDRDVGVCHARPLGCRGVHRPDLPGYFGLGAGRGRSFSLIRASRAERPRR